MNTSVFTVKCLINLLPKICCGKYVLWYLFTNFEAYCKATKENLTQCHEQ